MPADRQGVGGPRKTGTARCGERVCASLPGGRAGIYACVNVCEQASAAATPLPSPKEKDGKSFALALVLSSPQLSDSPFFCLSVSLSSLWKLLTLKLPHLIALGKCPKEGWVSLIFRWGLLRLDPALERRPNSGSAVLAGLIPLGVVCTELCWRMVLRSWGRTCSGSLTFLYGESCLL